MSARGHGAAAAAGFAAVAMAALAAAVLSARNGQMTLALLSACFAGALAGAMPFVLSAVARAAPAGLPDDGRASRAEVAAFVEAARDEAFAAAEAMHAARRRPAAAPDAAGEPTMAGPAAAEAARSGDGAALDSARRRAEASSAAKSRFLAMVSHEIRTPLNGILGMTGLLMQTPLTAEQRSYARAVETSGEALLLLIEDLLDFSKIEAGRLDLQLRPTPLAATVEELVELLAPRAAAKGIELAAYVDPSLPSEAEIDPVRLKQVLFNLAGNGIKFTAEGGVAVEVSPAGEAGDGRALVLFQVRDTGIGIEAADSERIFREFEQADPGPARSFGGTGLGLAIARQLVQLMGGDIRLDSRPGAGACFSFTIPLRPLSPGEAGPVGRADEAGIQRLAGARAAQERLFAVFGRTRPEAGAADDAPAGPHPVEGRRIAVVSHSLIEAPFVVRRLFDAGAEAVLVSQAELERALATGPAPDAVLVDGAAGDPLALMDRVRAVTDAPACILIAPRERPLLPELQAAGYGAYLVKPVRARSLIAAVTMLTTNAPFGMPRRPGGLIAAADGEDAEEPRPGDGLRVLLCDDNEINLLLGRGLVERLGAEVATVGDGRHAVRAVEAAEAEGRPFDLVLMDLHMPEVDGAEAARRIRERLGAASPRLIALTADLAEETREACDDLFADWLAKPLMPEALTLALAGARAAPPPPVAEG